MKIFIHSAFAVILAATTAASPPHVHRHLNLHARKSVVNNEVIQPNVIRTTTTEEVVEFVLDGKIIDPEDAREGLETGKYTTIGESTSARITSHKDTDVDLGLQMISKDDGLENPSKGKSTQTPMVGVNREFPNNTIKCSDFPSDYGARRTDWVNLGGWSGIQHIDNFVHSNDVSAAIDSDISTIRTAIAGGSCTSGSYCSYACHNGYEKAQWPESQGKKGESIGGLWCNSNGLLELTHPDAKTLCNAGEGGVSIKNDMAAEVNACRTDYPGNEKMVISTTVKPGETVDLTNPLQSRYLWKGNFTTAQYYMQPAGVSKEKGCIWKSDDVNRTHELGDNAAVIVGTGFDPNKNMTFLGLFANHPERGLKPDYNIEILVDNETKSTCYYNGAWSDTAENGCTVAVHKGQNAVIRIYKPL